MLPPFVPPSARSASDHLPPITDFVIDKSDQSFDKSFGRETFLDDAGRNGTIQSPLADNAIDGASAGVRGGFHAFNVSAEERAPDKEIPGAPDGPTEITVEQGKIEKPVNPFIVAGIEYSATLPLIEQFVLRAPYVERPGAVADKTEVRTTDEPQLVQLRHAVREIEEVKDETVEPATSTRVEATTSSTLEHWWPTASQPQANTPIAESKTEVTSAEVSSDASVSAEVTKQKDWMDEERDAFDWNSVANLAASPDDDERAIREWMSTDWETRPASTSQSEQIASVLMQLARRVRSGELKIESVRGMSTEAALAAVLTSLLSEPELELDSSNRE